MVEQIDRVKTFFILPYEKGTFQQVVVFYCRPLSVDATVYFRQ